MKTQFSLNSFLFIVWLLYECRCSSLSVTPSQIRIDSISHLVSETLNSDHEGDKTKRYASVRSMASVHQTSPRHELVYGELSIPVLATILDAVQVEENDAFLDIGSGDGALSIGAAMLYPKRLRISRGLEIMPGLVARSRQNAEKLSTRLELPVEFTHGNVHHTGSDKEVASILSDSTLAVCFATTWSADNARSKDKTSLRGRLLPKLSAALCDMPVGARIVLVDGRLDPKDGFEWGGDMKISCPDTAPFSIATLYERK